MCLCGPSPPCGCFLSPLDEFLLTWTPCVTLHACTRRGLSIREEQGDPVVSEERGLFVRLVFETSSLDTIFSDPSAVIRVLDAGSAVNNKELLIPQCFEVAQVSHPRRFMLFVGSLAPAEAVNVDGTRFPENQTRPVETADVCASPLPLLFSPDHDVCTSESVCE